MEERKEIQVVSGDGSNLNISPVYDHLNDEKPKSTKDKPKNIVVPKSNEKKDKEHSEEKK